MGTRSILTKAEQELFDKFWKPYPKKRAKGDAEKAFKVLRATQDDIESWLETLTWQIIEWGRRGDPQYIPYPATYLRARMFEDEQDAATVKKPTFSFD